MSNGGIDLIKQDMLFYLDKTFQFSFVYVGAVFAALAGAKSFAVSTLACNFNIKPPVMVVFAAILLLNLLYLTLTVSCGFAVLKRADFILEHSNDLGDGGRALGLWERFTRRGNEVGFRRTWNIDNYFSVSLYLVVLCLSVGLFVYCVTRSHGCFRVILCLLIGAHVLPFGVAILPMRKLIRRCQFRAHDVNPWT